MSNRPTPLTVVAIIQLICGCSTALSVVASLTMPMMREAIRAQPHALPLPVQLAITIIGGAAWVVSGIGVLKRHHFARWLFVGWTGLSLLLSLAISPSKLMVLPGAVIVLVLGALLFTRKANAWFAAPATGSEHA